MDPKVSEYFRQMGRKGGKARIASMTPEDRKKMASKGGKALVKKIKNNA